MCRRELPVLEENLNKLTASYDVLALAHSEYGPTLDWVQNNLNGDLKIGFSIVKQENLSIQIKQFLKIIKIKNYKKFNIFSI